jgi:hypothetical protein
VRVAGIVFRAQFTHTRAQLHRTCFSPRLVSASRESLARRSI